MERSFTYTFVAKADQVDFQWDSSLAGVFCNERPAITVRQEALEWHCLGSRPDATTKKLSGWLSGKPRLPHV